MRRSVGCWIAIGLAVSVWGMSGCTAGDVGGARADGALDGVRRIVFLGDSITYGGDYVVDFECWLLKRHRGRSIEVLNLGLPSETASGLSEPSHMKHGFARPDLHDAVEETGARIIHLTCPVYDSHGKQPSYDEVLAAYSAWLLGRREDGWNVVDIHGPMARRLAARRRDDPAFTFAKDGVHPNREGHAVMALPLLRYFGEPEAKADGDEELRDLVKKRMALLRDAWLTSTGHKRPMKKGLPLEEAKAKAAALTLRINELAGRGMDHWPRQWTRPSVVLR